MTSFSNTGNGNASVSSFNVRRGDNAIDGIGINGFDNFFGLRTNKFLVIGDNSGDFNSHANGGTSAIPSASSTMSMKFALSAITLGNPKSLDISFDYAFDTNTRNTDQFIAELILQDLSTINLVNHTAAVPNSSSTRGNFNVSIAYIALMASPSSYLNFRLVEGRNGGSSAVGIDNINVTARVPEPGVLSLIGIGLFGLSQICRKSLSRDRSVS